MDGGYDLPNFVLIFAGAICLGAIPVVLIAKYMLTKKVQRPDWKDRNKQDET